MSSKLLIPILNNHVYTYIGTIIYLSDDVSIETITPEDFGLILSSEKTEQASLINKKTKCIKINNID